MMDEIWGLGLGFLAAHILVGLVLLAVLRRMRAELIQGGPPSRELHPYEVAYLHGGGRHAIAASVTALRLDRAVDAYADGGLVATAPVGDGPRAAGKPLDAAVYAAIVGGGSTLAGLTADAGVRAALDQLRTGWSRRAWWSRRARGAGCGSSRRSSTDGFWSVSGASS